MLEIHDGACVTPKLGPALPDSSPNTSSLAKHLLVVTVRGLKQRPDPAASSLYDCMHEKWILGSLCMSYISEQWVS